MLWLIHVFAVWWGSGQAGYAAYALSLGLPAIIRAIYLCAFIAAGAAAAMQVYGPVVK